MGTTCDEREGDGRRASLGFVLKGWVWTDYAFRLEPGKWKRRKPEGARLVWGEDLKGKRAGRGVEHGWKMRGKKAAQV